MQTALPLIFTLVTLIYRCVTFAKKNIVENIVMIVCEALIVILQFIVVYTNFIGNIENDKLSNIITPIVMIFTIIAVVGLFAAIILDFIMFVNEYRRFYNGEIIEMYKRRTKRDER